MMTWEHRWGGDAGAYEAYAAGYGASFAATPSATRWPSSVSWPRR